MQFHIENMQVLNLNNEKNLTRRYKLVQTIIVKKFLICACFGGLKHKYLQKPVGCI